MTNGIRKVRKAVGFFYKRIFASCKFISDSGSEYGLVYSYLFLAPGRVLTGITVHGAQPISILLSMFPFPSFLVRGRGKIKIERPLLLCTIIFFFQVGCTALLFHTGFCSATSNWRELYKKLTVLSSFDNHTHRTRFNRKN